MKRRALLGVLATGGSVAAGCLDDTRDSDSTDDCTRLAARGTNSSDGGDGNQSDETSAPPSDDTDPSETPLPVPDPSGECGIASEPLSSRLVDDSCNSCSEGRGLEPSFELANERADAVSVTVVIESDGDTALKGIYDLDPGERVVRHRAGPAGDLEDVRMTIDGEDELTGTFDGTSCRRHAIALTDEGFEIGYVDPLAGWADTQHDCYTGDSSSIHVYNDETSRTVTVTVVDHCAETTDETVLELEPEAVERLSGALTSGGMFDVVADVEGGSADRYEFHEECWGLTITFSDDGMPEIRTIPIY